MRILLPEIPGGTARVSPLVLAIQARYQEDPDQDFDLPNTIHALLWACCSPHDFGVPEVSPLCEALRSGDDMAVSLLLQHRASPSMREEGSNDPIFVAIQMSSAENVHRLLQYSANPQVQGSHPVKRGSCGKTQTATTHGLGGCGFSSTMSISSPGFHGWNLTMVSINSGGA